MGAAWRLGFGLCITAHTQSESTERKRTRYAPIKSGKVFIAKEQAGYFPPPVLVI